eukprot:jgi/Hompol1/2908/HPOL_006223-RA
MLFATIALGGLSSISLAFVFEVFLSNSRTGPSIGLLILIAMASCLVALMSTVNIQRSGHVALCIFPPVAWFYSFVNIAQADIPADLVVDKSDGITHANALMFLGIDTLVFALLGWYLTQVVPQPYGSPRSPFFIFSPSYWFPSRFVSTNWDVVSNDDGQNILKEQLNGKQQVGISIKNLTKAFKHPTTGVVQYAVQNLSFDVPTGSVIGLLGRNGAGKTTLISMLTGLLPPTSGDAVVEGRSVLSGSRPSGLLGVCPQQDTIFPTLTIRETLALYAGIKNVPLRSVKHQIDETIASIGLVEKQNALSGSLSGGQKRRLSVGIAFIGGSRIVILDEMSSGVDPVSRRGLWDIVQKNKQGRTILLTTHFLDEAEALSDQIAIMAEGKLRCIGSSMFLKQHFGVGYTLVVVYKSAATQRQIDSLTATVTSIVPHAELGVTAGGEIQFRLPSRESARFGHLIRMLGTNAEIQSYGLSGTTLEEVFMRINMGETNAGAQRSLSIHRGDSFKSTQSDGINTFQPRELSAKNEEHQTKILSPSVSPKPRHGLTGAASAGRPPFTTQTVALMRKVLLGSIRD